MRIVFALPKVSRFPVGGYKMVFEYANRLDRMGYQVAIVYLNDDFLSKYSIPVFLRKIIAKIYTKNEPRWLSLNRSIQKKSFFSGDVIKIYEDDCLIATAVQTIDFIEKFDCKKIYFIQGYESWGVSEDYLIKTYGLGMRKIVIGNWLKAIVDKYSPKKSIVIKNPIDVNIYKLYTPLKERKRHSVAVLYNESPEKGFECSYKVLQLLKMKYPDLVVYMFGRREFPGKLPNWIEYTENASQEETVQIYNKSYVYLCSSTREGYGLTGLEAMACGCVLVSTRFDGVLEYADDTSALLSAIMDVNALIENIQRAFENLDLCEELTNNARKKVSELSWNDAVKKLISVIDGVNGDEFSE